MYQSDRHRGSFQNTLDATVNNTFPGRYNGLLLSERDKAACNAYLNPGHGNNVAEAQPLPDATPGKVFLFKSQWQVSVTLPAGDSQFSVFNLPYFETPFAYRSGTGSIIAVCSPHAIGTTITTNSSSFMLDQHVYGFRCVGKSQTVDLVSAVINRGGSCLAARKPSDEDRDNLNFTTVQTAGNSENSHILQRMPLTLAALSALSSSTSSRPAELGAYLVSHHEDHAWRLRQNTPSKCYPAADANGLLYGTLGITDQAGADAGFVNVSGLGNNLRTPVGLADGTDIPVAMFTALPTAATPVQTFTIKYSMVYEFWLKASSPLYPQTIERPISNPHLMDSLLAYEAELGKLASGGIMIADANAWSDIWTGFKNFIGKALNVTKQVVPAAYRPLISGLQGITGLRGGEKGSFLGPDFSEDPAPARVRTSSKQLAKALSSGSKVKLGQPHQQIGRATTRRLRRSVSYLSPAKAKKARANRVAARKQHDKYSADVRKVLAQQLLNSTRLADRKKASAVANQKIAEIKEVLNRPGNTKIMSIVRPSKPAKIDIRH